MKATVDGNEVEAEILAAMDGGTPEREEPKEHKRRGRPPGSTNAKKEKVRIQIDLSDPSFVEMISDAPYTAMCILALHPKIRRACSPPDKFVANSRKCMSKFLESLQISVHPLVAYAGVTLAGLTMCAVQSRRLTDEEYGMLREAMKKGPTVPKNGSSQQETPVGNTDGTKPNIAAPSA